MDTATPNTLSLLPAKVAKHFPPDVPFARLGVWGEGSCFFLSICAAKNHKGYLTASPEEQRRIGREYRCAFSKKITDERWSEHMREHKLTGLTAAEARRNFCTSTVWANEPMITFVSKELGLNVLFIDTESSKMYCGVHGDAEEPMVVVLWVERAHFEPVGAIRATRDAQTGMQFMFSPHADARIVNHVINAYAAQCDV